MLTFVALRGGGQATAQEANALTGSAVQAASPESTSAIADLADDLLDKLVAEGTMTEVDADTARSAIAAARERFALFDWDSVTGQVEALVERFRAELVNTDWDTIRGQLEEVMRDLEPEIGNVEPQLDASDWAELEEAFNQFRNDLDQLDLDLIVGQIERRVDDIDWDAWSTDLREQLDNLDLSDFDQFDPSQFEEFKRHLEDVDWDAIIGQFDGFSF
jgi:hypothetical protein